MTSWLWIAAGLAVCGCLLLALKLWGAQIIAGVIRIAAEAAWETLANDRKSPEEEARDRADYRASIRRKGKDA